jgi:hypothetical protein
MECGHKMAGTMLDKVLTRVNTDNPNPENEQAIYLKELWDLSRNSIRHALSQNSQL